MKERLEDSIDRAAKIYIRKDLGNEEYLEGYGHVGKGPKNFRRSDKRMKEDVCEALTLSYDVDASDIEVEVKDRKVFLRGEVDDRESKRAAEDCVDGVPGVVDVQNELKFKRKPTISRMMSPPEDELGTRLS